MLGHPHATMDKEAIADRYTILRVQVGSGVHGVTIENQDDRDEMGICIEPPEYVIGLRQFEQYEFRTQPVGHRSGPGDLDLVVYSLRKWMRLALQGNPTVLLPLFVPDSEVCAIDEHGRWLRDHPEMILSRQVAHRFIGYLRSQREQLLGIKSKKHTNRPISLPMPEPSRTWLRELRRGEHTKDEALEIAKEGDAALVPEALGRGPIAR